MRFLEQNILGSYNQQILFSATSGDPFDAFSDTFTFNYQSSGQDSDGNIVILQQDFGSDQTIDTIVVLKHNFADFAIYISSGAGFTDVTSSAVLQNSVDGLNKIYKFTTPISFTKIKFEVSGTIPANSEKTVGAILGMLEIGVIDRFTLIKPKGNIEKKTLKLESGGMVTLYKGSNHWEFSINTDLVTVQNGIDIVEILQNKTTDFWLWINDGYDGDETVKQEPYRFEDFKRCVYTGNLQPMFYKNYLNKNANNKLKFAQTPKVDYFDGGEVVNIP